MATATTSATTAVQAFLVDHPAYLRWARILSAAGNRVGGVVMLRDAMGRYGVPGFSILHAVGAIADWR
jgi:hypothetical protein